MTREILDELSLLLSAKKSELICLGLFVFNSFTLNYLVLRSPASSFIEYRPIWPTFIVWLVNFLVFMGMIFLKEHADLKPVNVQTIVILTICARLVYLVHVFISDIIYIDHDVEHFFILGVQFSNGTYPSMGYPQGVLLFFTLTVLLANNNLLAFRWIFPLVQLPFELLIVLCLYKMAKQFNVVYHGSILSLFYALLPLLTIFWYSKYDVIPTSFFLLALYFFLKESYSFSALFITLGFLTKWFPILLAPFIIVYLLRKRMFSSVLKYVSIICILSAIVMLPFFFLSPEKFFYPYIGQGSRTLMGESFFYIFYYFLEPSRRIPAGMVPWVPVVGSIYFTRTKLVVCQLSILFLTFLLFICRPAHLHSTISFGGISIVLFTLLNRIYSPQFLIWFIVAYMTSYLIHSNHEKRSSWFFFFLGLLPLLNYLIWPMTVTYWFFILILFFLDCWILVVYLLFPNAFARLQKINRQIRHVILRTRFQ